MKKVFTLFVAWRILLFIPLYAGFIFIPYHLGFDYVNLWKFIKPYTPVSNPLLFPWANFDGVHYLSIAANGYSNDQGFFPLYPILIRVLALVFGGGEPFGFVYFISGFVVSNISFLVALFVFYKLIQIDFPKKIALISIIMLLLFPTSFFFGSLYTEGLFLLLSLSSFYFARKKNWALAGFFGMLLSSTRLVGVFILPALLYEFWVSEKKLFSAKILPLLAIPLGLLAYAYYNFLNFHNPLIFIEAHAKLNPTRTVNSVVLFPQTIYRYFRIITTVSQGSYEWWVAVLEILSFIFAASLLYLAWKKRLRTSYVIFSVLCFLLPVSSGTFSGLPRYILALFPMFMALALVKNPILRVMYCAISIILLFILLMLFSRGYFIA